MVAFTHSLLGIESGISVAIMYLFMRVTATAMCYADGDTKRPLSRRQMEQRILELPSFFEYMAYCNSSITMGVGGFYEFNDFNNLMHLKGHYHDLPSSVFITIKRMLIAFSNIPLSFLSVGSLLQRTSQNIPSFNKRKLFPQLRILL